MLATVTGASGFVGGNLARELLARGISVRAADREPGPALEGLDVEFVAVDVLEPDSLRAAFAGTDVVFHLAAVISISGDPTGIVRRVNVEGPANAAAAALEQGVRRFVHCSSVHTFDLERCGPSLDERGPRSVADHCPAYDLSKQAGEAAVREVVARGLDAVIVNPTGVIGPFDYGPSRMGLTIKMLRSRKIPVNLGGGFDFVDVRDVAAGMLGAMERGRTGESYLLSGTRVSVKELGVLVSEASGVKPPRLDVPLRVVEPLAGVALRFAPSGQIPLFTPDALHALRYSPTVSHWKASIELGYVSRAIHETIHDTVAWFDAHEATEAKLAES